jgi:hypothetical protein
VKLKVDHLVKIHLEIAQAKAAWSQFLAYNGLLSDRRPSPSCHPPHKSHPHTTLMILHRRLQRLRLAGKLLITFQMVNSKGWVQKLKFLLPWAFH